MIRYDDSFCLGLSYDNFCNNLLLKKKFYIKKMFSRFHSDSSAT